MSFKYPPASASVLKGNGFYRIKAQAIDVLNSSLSGVGPGDLVPIDVGFSAIVVGPESDYENYELYYLDPTSPGGIQVFPFSKDTPLLGSVAADNSVPYPTSDGEKAQAFVRIADIGTLDGFLTGDPGEHRVAETLVDLIIYTGATPTQLNTRRSPKRRSSNVPLSSTRDQLLYIPGYGRRIFTMECNKGFVAGNVTAQVDGLRLYSPLVSDTSVPDLATISGKTAVQVMRKTLLVATAVVGATGNDSLIFSYNADNDGSGYFDFYRVNLASDVDALPSDFSRARGFHLTMEVRD